MQKDPVVAHGVSPVQLETKNPGNAGVSRRSITQLYSLVTLAAPAVPGFLDEV